MNTPIDPIGLSITLALLSLLPVLVVVCTAFLKISVVIVMLRNALGVQQIPPNIALYALALILTAYIMAPVGQRMYDQFGDSPVQTTSVATFFKRIQASSAPLKDFMLRHAQPQQRRFFAETAQRLWGPELAADVKDTDFLVVMPAFLVSELTAAFQIGFLLYLPFVLIDLIVSNILLAMGMMMVSPVMISLPLKLFLFVALDGWTRLLQGLVLSYT